MLSILPCSYFLAGDNFPVNGQDLISGINLKAAIF
jgi:hypothetical protein